MVIFAGLKAHGIDPGAVEITLDGRAAENVLRFDHGFVDFYKTAASGAAEVEDGGYVVTRTYGHVEARVVRGPRRWTHGIPEPRPDVPFLDLFRVLSHVG